MKKLIPIILIIVILLTTVASADSTSSIKDIDIQPRVETTLTKMLQSFIENRLNFHNREYYAIWLNNDFIKGEEFDDMHHIWIDGKAIIPNHYYFDVVITGTVIWQYDNGIEKLYPNDYQLYYYRYYPNTGEYTFYSSMSSFMITNYGSELMFTNFSGAHGAFPLGEYTLLNPAGIENYWGSINIFHDLKLYDLTQLVPLLNAEYGKGYNKGHKDGLEAAINESDAYNKGYSAGRTKGYNDGFIAGQTTTDETTRNLLAFGGSVIGSIFSFILYVSTSVEIFGIKLIDILVALAILSILVFVLKFIKG